jgi:hypothetical protein
MKKSAKPRKQSARKGRPRGTNKPCRAVAKAAKPLLIRTVYGEDERGIPYRKDIYEGGITTTYGPLPSENDDCGGACYLIKRQRAGRRAKWNIYGPDITLLRGDMAKTALQGRWGDLDSMVLARSMESVRDHPERWDEVDGKILKSAMIDPEMLASFRAAQRALHGGGLVRYGELPRPLRIARAVVEASKTHNRPPTPREVFKQFVLHEKAEGREVWAQKETDAVQPDLWQTKAQASFYKALHSAGWGWLVDSP